jgi:hypothetical protein
MFLHNRKQHLEQSRSSALDDLTALDPTIAQMFVRVCHIGSTLSSALRLWIDQDDDVVLRALENDTSFSLLKLRLPDSVASSSEALSQQLQLFCRAVLHISKKSQLVIRFANDLATIFLRLAEAGNAEEQMGIALVLDALVEPIILNPEADGKDLFEASIKFASTLRIVLSSNMDKTTLTAAARALGKLAKASDSTVRVEFVRFETDRALEWLQLEAHAPKRLAAVLILRHLADNVPALFLAHQYQFFNCVGSAVYDTSQDTRLSAKDAIRTFLDLISTKEEEEHCFRQCYSIVHRGIERIGTSASVHGSLLAIGELLRKPSDLMNSVFAQLCAEILRLRNHPNPLVRGAVVSLVPRLVAYNRDFVRTQNMQVGLDCILTMASSPKSSKQLASRALEALGKVAMNVGNPTAFPEIRNVVNVVRGALRDPVLRGHATMCVLHLANAGWGRTLIAERLMVGLLDDLFNDQDHFHPELVPALDALCKKNPQIEPLIRARLLHAVSLILSDEPFDAPEPSHAVSAENDLVLRLISALAPQNYRDGRRIADMRSDHAFYYGNNSEFYSSMNGSNFSLPHPSSIPILSSTTLNITSTGNSMGGGIISPSPRLGPIIENKDNLSSFNATGGSSNATATITTTTATTNSTAIHLNGHHQNTNATTNNIHSSSSKISNQPSATGYYYLTRAPPRRKINDIWSFEHALRALRVFDFGGVNLLPFIHNHVRYLMRTSEHRGNGGSSSSNSSNPDEGMQRIRMEAALTTASVLGKFIESSWIRGGISKLERQIVFEVIVDLLDLAISNRDPTIRVSILTSISNSNTFGSFTAQKSALNILILCLKDENFDARRAALKCVMNLAPMNPAPILAALRKDLIGLVGELSSSRVGAREEAALLIGDMIEGLHECATLLLAGGFIGGFGSGALLNGGIATPLLAGIPYGGSSTYNNNSNPGLPPAWIQSNMVVAGVARRVGFVNGPSSPRNNATNTRSLTFQRPQQQQQQPTTTNNNNSAETSPYLTRITSQTSAATTTGMSSGTGGGINNSNLTSLATTNELLMQQHRHSLLSVVLGPYVPSLMTHLLTALRANPPPELSSACLRAIGMVTLVGDDGANKYFLEAFPLVVDSLRDSSSTKRREAALDALSKLVRRTGMIEEPMMKYPWLLDLLLEISSDSSMPWFLQSSALRTLGTLGALNPVLHAARRKQARAEQAENGTMSIGIMAPPQTTTATTIPTNVGVNNLQQQQQLSQQAPLTTTTTTTSTTVGTTTTTTTSTTTGPPPTSSSTTTTTGTNTEDHAPGTIGINASSTATAAAATTITTTMNNNFLPSNNNNYPVFDDDKAFDLTVVAVGSKIPPQDLFPVTLNVGTTVPAITTNNNMTTTSRSLSFNPDDVEGLNLADFDAFLGINGAGGQAAPIVVVGGGGGGGGRGDDSEDEGTGGGGGAGLAFAPHGGGMDTLLTDLQHDRIALRGPVSEFGSTSQDQLEEHFRFVAMRSLTKILRNTSLSSVHIAVIEAAGNSCRSLGTEILPFVPALVPSILRLALSPSAERELRTVAIKQLTVFISVLKRNMRLYLKGVYALAVKYWDENIFEVLTLIEDTAHSLKDEFQKEIAWVGPRLIATLRGERFISIKAAAISSSNNSSTNSTSNTNNSNGSGGNTTTTTSTGSRGGVLSLTESNPASTSTIDKSSSGLPTSISTSNPVNPTSSSLPSTAPPRESIVRRTLATISSLATFWQESWDLMHRLVMEIVNVIEDAHIGPSTKIRAIESLESLCEFSCFESEASPVIHTLFVTLERPELRAASLKLLSVMARSHRAGYVPLLRSLPPKFRRHIFPDMDTESMSLWSDYGGVPRSRLYIHAMGSGNSGGGGDNGKQDDNDGDDDVASVEGAGVNPLLTVTLRDFPRSSTKNDLAGLGKSGGGGGGGGDVGAQQTNPTPLVNPHRLREAWDTSQITTEDDWLEWMRRFSLELLRESPDPALRVCATVAQTYHNLSRDLFNASFALCWTRMSEDNCVQLVKALKTAFRHPKTPSDVLHLLLNLAEFMEHNDRALPIHTRQLAEYAQRCHAYAKALHYKEIEFATNPQGSVDELISINNRLDHHEAAAGLLKVIQLSDGMHFSNVIFGGAPAGATTTTTNQTGNTSTTTTTNNNIPPPTPLSSGVVEKKRSPSITNNTLPPQQQPPPPPTNPNSTAATENNNTNNNNNPTLTRNISINSPPQRKNSMRNLVRLRESWFEQLGRWRDALESYETKIGTNPSANKNDLYLQTGAMRCLFSLGEFNRLYDVGKKAWERYSDDKSRRSLAPLIAHSLWALGEWDEMQRYVPYVNESSLDGAVVKLVLAIMQGDWSRARARVDETKKLLASDIATLVSESYTRAYHRVVIVQQITELEEIGALRNPSGGFCTNYGMDILPISGSGSGVSIPGTPAVSSTGMDSPMRIPLFAALNSSNNINNGTGFSSLTLGGSRLYPDGNMNEDLSVSGGGGGGVGINTGGGGAAPPAGVGADYEIRLAKLRELWSKRLKVCQRNVYTWQQILAARRLVVDPLEDSQTWIKFVSICRREERWGLGASTLLRLGVDENDCLGSLRRGCPPAGLYALYKLRWAGAADRPPAGDRSKCVSGLLQFVDALESNPELLSRHQDLAVKARLKLGDWILFLEPEARDRAMKQVERARVLNPTWYKATHSWALFNFYTFEKTGNLNNLVAAVEGFFDAIALGRSRGSSSSSWLMQDVLRLLTLWFDQVHKFPKAAQAIAKGFESRRIPLDTWLNVVPQLIARLQSAPAGLVQLLVELGSQYPQSLVYPLTVASRSVDSRVKSAAEGILSELRGTCGELLDQAALVARELIRVAILLPEEWYEALEDACKAWFPVPRDEDLKTSHVSRERFQALKAMKESLSSLNHRLALGHIPLVQHTSSGSVSSNEPPSRAGMMQGEENDTSPRIITTNLYDEQLAAAAAAAAAAGGGGGGLISGLLGDDFTIGSGSGAANTYLHTTTKHEQDFYKRFRKRLENAANLVRTYEGNRGYDASTNGKYAGYMTKAWHEYRGVYNEIRETYVKDLGVLDLQDISPLLLMQRDLELAVPGTFRPSRRNDIVKISMFSPRVVVFSTKQRPRRLAILGSNGLTYQYLLKGHEDLRQDERAMQLFGLVNALLARKIKSQTSRKDLSIQQYIVIPLSPHVGLIGWLPETDTFHTLVRRYRAEKRIPLNLEQQLSYQVVPYHGGQIMGQMKNVGGGGAANVVIDPSGPGNAEGYDRLTLMQKIEAFQYALHNSPGDDLAKVLWYKSRNAEVWLERRTNFTRSLACMSMVGYILGLGDRHPSNLMLHRSTGRVVHIDFGDCFEVAMNREKFPERVPFRLTRMLVQAMDVSGIEGTFRFSCEAVMNVLREDRHSVMAMLEAFVHDPLISWRLWAVEEDEENVGGGTTTAATVAATAGVAGVVASATTPGTGTNAVVGGGITTTTTTKVGEGGNNIVVALPTNIDSTTTANIGGGSDNIIANTGITTAAQFLSGEEILRNPTDVVADRPPSALKSTTLQTVLEHQALTRVDSSDVVLNHDTNIIPPTVLATGIPILQGENDGNLLVDNANNTNNNAVMASTPTPSQAMPIASSKRGRSSSTSIPILPPAASTTMTTPAAAAATTTTTTTTTTAPARGITTTTSTTGNASSGSNDVVGGGGDNAVFQLRDGALTGSPTTTTTATTTAPQNVNTTAPSNLGQSFRSRAIRDRAFAKKYSSSLDRLGSGSTQLNPQAVSVIRRVRDKLTGHDFSSNNEADDAGPLDVTDQVERLIKQATDHANLCAAFAGWCAFW